MAGEKKSSLTVNWFFFDCSPLNKKNPKMFPRNGNSFRCSIDSKKDQESLLGDFEIVSAGKFSSGGRVNELHPATVLKRRMPSPFYASPLYRAATLSRNAAILFSLLKLSFLLPCLQSQSHFHHQDRTLGC